MNTCIFIPNHIFHYIPHYNSPEICVIPAGKIIFVAKSQIGELAISNKLIQKLCVYYSSVINSEISVFNNALISTIYASKIGKWRHIDIQTLLFYQITLFHWF